MGSIVLSNKWWVFGAKVGGGRVGGGVGVNLEKGILKLSWEREFVKGAFLTKRVKW